jgi:hypothetical protein
MRHSARNAILLLLFALSAWPAARALELEVTGLDGRTVRGRLVQVMPEIILATPSEQFVRPWSGILALRPIDAEAPAGAGAESGPLRFELTDGSAFGGRVESAAERGFVARVWSGRTCRLESTSLRAIRSTAASAAALAALTEVAADQDRAADVAVIERGLRVIVLRGAVREIDADRVVFSWKQRELPLPWERVAGLSFARPLARRSNCSMYLRGGDVFSGRVVAGDETGVTLESSILGGLALPWSRVERIECRSRRLTFLSDLVELRYQFTPFFQKHWSYARDKTLTGRPIRLGGRLCAKGLTMHSRSSVVYALGRKYGQFAAVAGIADEMEDRGDVTLAVVGDGRVLWEARNVRGGEEPREVLVDVTDVRELSLHVDFGEGLDLSDHACWAMARLIR